MNSSLTSLIMLIMLTAIASATSWSFPDYLSGHTGIAMAGAAINTTSYTMDTRMGPEPACMFLQSGSYLAHVGFFDEQAVIIPPTPPTPPAPAIHARNGGGGWLDSLSDLAYIGLIGAMLFIFLYKKPSSRNGVSSKKEA